MAQSVTLKAVIKGIEWVAHVHPSDGRTDFYRNGSFKANGVHHPEKGWEWAGAPKEVLDAMAPAVALHLAYLKKEWTGRPSGMRGV